MTNEQILRDALELAECTLCECHGHLYQEWVKPSRDKLRRAIDQSRQALAATRDKPA
jgi:hypothetical protein